MRRISFGKAVKINRERAICQRGNIAGLCGRSK